MICDPTMLRGGATRSGLSPALGASPHPVAILCFSDDMAFAERELLPPLAMAGYDVEALPSASEQLDKVSISSYALVLIEIASPDSPGYDLCAHLRYLDLPLMLVLRDTERTETLRGYEAGAHGCVIAPFDTREFLARLNALLRRSPSAHPHARRA